MSTTRAHFIPPPPQERADLGRILLKDGTAASLRPIRPDDVGALCDFFSGLSTESRYRRFFSPTIPQAADLRALCENDDPSIQFTLVVTRTLDETPRIVASATYSRLTDGRAEVAFAVDDSFQGKGLGSLLLERLAIIAVRHGITTFEAFTLSENRPMIEVFRHSGFQISTQREGSLVLVDLSLMPTEASVTRFAMRDRVATIASLRPFFQPRSVAVIGCFDTPQEAGTRIIESLRGSGYRGIIYPVPAANGVSSITELSNALQGLRESPELALISLPPEQTSAAIDACATAGVRAVIVTSGGYAETGRPESESLQQQLVQQIRGHGMRLIGPNALGLLNTDPTIQLNTLLYPGSAVPGRVAIASQSSVIGLAVLARAQQMGLGLSAFVSLGNKGDVSGNDLLQYWEEEERTSAILLYLESFGNARRFAHLVRRVSRRKPVVVVKSGREARTTEASASARAMEALVRQSGILRADTLGQMFDLALALTHQPLPSGRRVALITNGRGPGVLGASSCEASGLEVVNLSASTLERLKDELPSTAIPGNPLELEDEAAPEQFRRAIRTIMECGEVDSLVVLYNPRGAIDAAGMRLAISQGVETARSHSSTGQTIVACSMMAERDSGPLPITGRAETIPVYRYPESAGRVLGQLAQHNEWLQRPEGVVPELEGIKVDKLRNLCQSYLARNGPGLLENAETAAFLSACGFAVGDSAVRSDDGVPRAKISMTVNSAFGPLMCLSPERMPWDLPAPAACRLLPLTDLDAQEMVTEILGAPRTEHFIANGNSGAGLEEIVLRLARISEEVPDCYEIVLSPVTVPVDGSTPIIEGARVRIGAV